MNTLRTVIKAVQEISSVFGRFPLKHTNTLRVLLSNYVQDVSSLIKIVTLWRCEVENFSGKDCGITEVLYLG